MKHTIICDIDGTIADLTHRIECIRPPEGQRKDWDAFHARVGDDAPHYDMRMLLVACTAFGTDRHGADRKIIYVSGRMAKTREATREWLNKYGFPHGALYMRDDGDFRSDDIVKEEILDKLGLTPEDVLFVLDDRDRVVAMWRRRGFRCLQVAPGDF